MGRTRSAWAALTLALLPCCAPHPPSVPPTTIACASSPVVGDRALDTAYPAVGAIGGCTATLVAPDVVLFAAHCVSKYAQGCWTKSQAMRGLAFSMSRTGCFEDVSDSESQVDCARERFSWPVDDLEVQPRAYDHEDVKRCPPDAPSSVRCPPEGGAELSTGQYPAFDLALAHLALRPSNITPASLSGPLRIVTAIDDDVAGLRGVHARIEPLRFEAPAPCPRPVGIIVGWGTSDLSPSVVRVSGTADFFDGPSWDRVTSPVFSCDPASSEQSGALEAQALRMHRGSSRIGAFDLEIPWTGDSGSPLLVLGGHGPRSIPELEDGVYVFGVLSGGELVGLPVAAGLDVVEVYAATFEPSNARFIEETLARFADRATREEDLRAALTP